MRIPPAAFGLLLLPFFLNDLAIVFLKIALLPTETLAYFYYRLPWIGQTLASLHPDSMRVLPYRQILLWSQDLLVFVVGPLLFYYTGFRRAWFTWETLGLRDRPHLWDWIYSLVLAGQLFIVGWCLRLLLLQYQPEWEAFLWFGYDFPSELPWKWLILIYASLSAGVVEELVFRGTLIPWLESRALPRWVAVVLAALVFAGIHWCQGPLQLIQTFVLGLIWGAAFSVSRKLWPLILSHIFLDLFLFWPK
ncbi:MAG: CPBP family intramembrane metalloprotease [Blastochloris sp.]|nr:CPBP family intramembrane metalloprotease [Blastochloris sp.]